MKRLMTTGLLALVVGCGAESETREVVEISKELLYHPEELRPSHVRGPEGGAPADAILDESRMRVGHVRPAPTERGGPTQQESPALLFSPNWSVSFTVPALLTLDVAFGVDGGSLRGIPAKTRLDLGWSVRVEGELVAEGRAKLHRNGGAPGWSELDLGEPTAHDREVVLTMTTSTPEAWAALGDAMPEAGFARLRLLEQRSVPRLPASPERPNVVLVVMDTLRGDRTGPGGYHRPTTPHLDALADRGTRFTQALSTSSWTWPSTASMLTGLLPEEHGVEAAGASYFFGELDTLPEKLRREGASTAAFVGNQLISAPHGFDQGFDHFRSPGRSEFVDADVLVPEALDWLERHVTERPGERFFLYLHLVDPHRPYQPDVASSSVLPAEKPEGFRHVRPDDSFRELWLEVNDRSGDGRPLYRELISPEHQAWLDDSYDQVVHTGDLWFGRVLEQLEVYGLEENTLVVFTSDHGEEFFEHGMFDHGQSLYPEVVGVPLVVAGPGVPPGRAIDEVVSNRRVFDLLASAAEGRTDAGLLEVGAGLAFTSTRRGIWNGTYETTVHAIRRGRWSLHLAPDSPDWGTPEGSPAPPGGTRRLYDLEADPTEHHDVSDEHPQVADELEDLLLRRLASSKRKRGDLGVDGAEGLGGLGAGDATIQLLKDIGYL